MADTKLQVFLYWPNIVGYVRILLFLFGCIFFSFDRTNWFLAFYFISALLDVLDGYLARKLNQVSLYGSWLDVVIDNIQRGFLWSCVSQWGSFLSAVEWLTFLSTHSYGSEWKKTTSKLKQPYIIGKISQKGYKTPMGYFALTAIHALPICLFVRKNQLLLLHSMLWGVMIFSLVLGRLAALSVELWLIVVHVEALLLEQWTEICT